MTAMKSYLAGGECKAIEVCIGSSLSEVPCRLHHQRLGTIHRLPPAPSGYCRYRRLIHRRPIYVPFGLLPFKVGTNQNRLFIFGPYVDEHLTYRLRKLGDEVGAKVLGLHAEFDEIENRFTSMAASVEKMAECEPLKYDTAPALENPLIGVPRKMWFPTTATVRDCEAIYVCRANDCYTGMRVQRQGRCEALGQHRPEDEHPLEMKEEALGICFQIDSRSDCGHPLFQRR